ncbi:hypothetical protein GCM10023085_58940 [Actinomadura viridis]|uniref:Uncharacterized protein n=1 Tax=Actinomadura viridis TaxID=58110 RepID=A0A931DSV2_9ACTN|nr:hypothetical protein [Actinomadura viridis]MBG6093312.1 hypothetical protein [Actinomadura viridis]
MLADASPVGDNLLLIIGPLIVFIALAAWLCLTAYAARQRTRADKLRGESPHRGPVQGGVIDRDSAQWSAREKEPHGD